VQPCHDLSCARVDAIDVAALEDGDPERAEGESHADGMRLGELGGHFPRARVDPGDGGRAGRTCGPDGASVSDDEPAGHEVLEVDAVDDLVCPGIDPHDSAAHGVGDPDRIAVRRQVQAFTATLAIRADADPRDNTIGGRVDPLDARPASVPDPDSSGRHGDSRGPRDADRRAHLVRLRVDA